MNRILNDGDWKENYKFFSPASLFLASSTSNCPRLAHCPASLASLQAFLVQTLSDGLHDYSRQNGFDKDMIPLANAASNVCGNAFKGPLEPKIDEPGHDDRRGAAADGHSSRVSVFLISMTCLPSRDMLAERVRTANLAWRDIIFIEARDWDS